MNPQDFWSSDHKVPSWLPDWRNEDEYPDVKLATKQDFAWEFLRRNLIYQMDYQRVSDLCASEGVQDRYKKTLGFNIFPPMFKTRSFPTYDLSWYDYKDRENVIKHTLGLIPPVLDSVKESSNIESIIFHSELNRVLIKWGLSYYLLDPAFESYSSSHPDTKVYEYCPQEESDPKVTSRNRYVSLDINQLNPDQQRRYRLVQDIDGKDNIDLLTVGRAGVFNCAADVINYKGQHIPIGGGIVPTDNEVPYLFDLSLPIEPQLLNAEARLKEDQKRLLGENIGKSKTSIKDYPTYLRVLDADARGVSNAEIKSVIPSLNLFVVRRGAYSLIDKNYQLLL